MSENASKDEAYLLLCDVALGNMEEKMDAVSVTKNKLPKGTSSVKGIGRECPNPIGDYNHADGYVVPKGPTHVQLAGKHGVDFRLLYNEYVQDKCFSNIKHLHYRYIVYDVDQVQLKYLVRVKCLQACHHYYD
ncbi:unnamed protein product [Caenorhabditis nigoni]